MSKFELGITYKLANDLTLGMQLIVQAKFSGEPGVFTVHEIADNGSIFTDDITSKVITSRCNMPANVIEDCEVVPCA